MCVGGLVDAVAVNARDVAVRGLGRLDVGVLQHEQVRQRRGEEGAVQSRLSRVDILAARAVHLPVAP